MKNNEFYCFYSFYCFILRELQSLRYFTIYYPIIIIFYFYQITIAFDTIIFMILKYFCLSNKKKYLI